MKISNLKKLLMLGLGAYSSVNNQVKAHSLQPNNLSVLDVTNVSGTDLINQPNINTQPSTMVYNNLSRINRIYDGNTRSTDLNGIFEERIADLMESEVTNQVSQILNYEDNHSLGEKQLVSLLANCNIALKKYNKHRDNKLFNTSLDNTVTALNNRQYYSYYLNNLKPNDTKSFLVAPVTSNNHLFSFVLYKKQDTKGNIFFQVVAVNKGALPFERGDNDQYHEMYESYKIPQQNIVELANMLGYDNGNIDPITGNWLTTGEVYKKIQDNTINKTWNTLDNIKARPQIVGNCYYKELEAGLKYAYSNAYDNWQIKKRMHGKTRLTPKWPVKTEEFQKTLIENIRDVVDEAQLEDDAKMRIKQHIDRMLIRYEKSKGFRKELEKEDDDDLTNDRIFKAFVTHFGGSRITTLEDLKDKDALKEVLRNVDFKTVNEYNDFFLYILDKSELEVPDFFKDSLTKNYVPQAIANYMFEHNKEDADFVKEYFESVYDIAEGLYNNRVRQERDNKSLQNKPLKEMPKELPKKPSKDKKSKSMNI